MRGKQKEAIDWGRVSMGPLGCEMGGGPGVKGLVSLEMTHFHLLSEGTEPASPWTGVSLPGAGWLGGGPVVLGTDISSATSKL